VQAIHYSGKKKGHYDKNVVVVSTRSKRVTFLSQTLPGAVHDKALADHADIHYPPSTTLRSDLGFQGYGPEVREHLQPKKSPRTPSWNRARNATIASSPGCACGWSIPSLESRFVVLRKTNFAIP
jgi:DDE superfamily endonuclease